MRFLVEASGSLTSTYLINSIKSAGHEVIASDINSHCAGRYLADDFMLMPKVSDEKLWDKVTILLKKHGVDVVIPSLDEMLLGWAERKEHFRNMGVTIICSAASTIRVFQDKWLTYRFFSKNSIPTPATSLTQDYPLLKPRYGRGAKGIKIASEPISMTGYISQEVVQGQEYTVDVLCNKDSKPLYIVPRIRQGVKDGKSTGGVVIDHPGITDWVQRICQLSSFQGPINLQCFICDDGSIKFIEINPRVAGGMALGFAATENWIPLLVNHFVYGKEIANLKPIQYGMMMRRYYAEVFVPPSNMGSN
ncbi:MAG: ATP-grasp domain-containing protein [Pelotomaculum sp.]